MPSALNVVKQDEKFLIINNDSTSLYEVQLSSIDNAKVREWITALRSGEFKQGTGALFDDETETFCCLGVLNAIGEEDMADDAAYLRNKDFDKIVKGTCKRVIVQQNLRLQVMFAELNDANYTFDDIAKSLEFFVENFDNNIGETQNAR